MSRVLKNLAEFQKLVKDNQTLSSVVESVYFSKNISEETKADPDFWIELVAAVDVLNAGDGTTPLQLPEHARVRHVLALGLEAGSSEPLFHIDEGLKREVDS